MKRRLRSTGGRGPALEKSPPEDVGSSSASEEVEDDSTHDQLLSSIALLGRKRYKTEPQRSEAVSSVSEYHLPLHQQDKGSKVSVGDLLTGLEGQKGLKKRLASTEEKSRPIDPPLAKHHADKIHREVAYHETAKHVSKWDPIVKKNRLAEHLSFPLQEEHIPQPSIATKVESFKPMNELEHEIAAVLAGSENVETNDEDLTAAEKKALLRMSLEEAEQRRNELQKMRALMSYHEQKCRRIKKIKSKKFHRIKRRQEAKKRENETGGDDVLEKADRLRARERVTLKHTSKAKWARQQLARGHKDPSTQLALSEHHQRGQQLKQKITSQDSSDSGSLYSESDCDEKDSPQKNSSNPWFESGTVTEKSNPVDKVLLLDTKNTESTSKSQQYTADSEDDSYSEDSNPMPDSREQNSQRVRVTFADPKNDVKSSKSRTASLHIDGTINLREKAQADTHRRPSSKHIDTSSFMLVSDSATDTGLRGASEHLLAVREAFAGDDVIESFSKEKAEEAKKSQPKDVDLTLPGWGVWGGEGVRPPKKRVRVIIPAVPAKPRKDAQLKHVIISEQKDKKLAKHLVNSLPWPYNSKEQFEKTHCAPLGRHWNTESTFQQLIKPRIRTSIGTVIEPLKLTEDIQDFMKRTGKKKSKKQKTKKTTA